MKKLLTLLLVLALLLPAAALAIDEADIIGCYAYHGTLDTGAPSMIMICLGPNHTCYCIAQAFGVDDAGIGRAHVGTWEIRPDGTVSADVGNDTNKELIISDDAAYAYDKELDRYYINISRFDDMPK